MCTDFSQPGHRLELYKVETVMGEATQDSRRFVSGGLVLRSVGVSQ